MEKNKRTVLTGSVIATALLSLGHVSANHNPLGGYSALGSGAEVRSALLGNSTSNSAFELKCGAKDSTHTKQAKGKDGKCGEGKCGESKKKDAKATSDKTKDSKCGQGKCGEGKKQPH